MRKLTWLSAIGFFLSTLLNAQPPGHERPLSVAIDNIDVKRLNDEIRRLDKLDQEDWQVAMMFWFEVDLNDSHATVLAQHAMDLSGKVEVEADLDADQPTYAVRFQSKKRKLAFGPPGGKPVGTVTFSKKATGKHLVGVWLFDDAPQVAVRPAEKTPVSPRSHHAS